MTEVSDSNLSDEQMVTSTTSPSPQNDQQEDVEENSPNIDKSPIDSTQEEENKNMTFENGVWIYTDPETSVKCRHDADSGQWVPLDSTAVSSSNSEGLSEAEKSDENMQCVNDIWVYRDAKTGEAYWYNATTNEWVKSGNKEEEEVKSGKKEEEEEDKEVDDSNEVEDIDKEESLDDFEFQLKQEQKAKFKSEQKKSSQIFTDPHDGTMYEWDNGRKGWFPVVDEDFIAKYQANYGYGDGTETNQTQQQPSTSEEPKEIDEEKAKMAAMSGPERKQYLRQKKKEKRKLEAEEEKNRQWFQMDEDHNTSVYIEGLPHDVTEDELKECMSKCGVIAIDPATRKLKMKLYKDKEGNLKGDALCSYVKRESVELASQILDGSDIRGYKLSVQLAHFEQKGDYDPSKKKKRLTQKQKKKFKEQQEKLFDWRPEKLRGERPKSDCTVIIKNLFTLQEFAENAARLLECRDEIRRECAKYGQVAKIVVYDNNPEGVASVSYSSPEQSDDCVTMMNYRIFNGKQLRAELWDGKTTYKIKETKTDEEKRLENWEKFIEQD